MCEKFALLGLAIGMKQLEDIEPESVWLGAISAEITFALLVLIILDVSLIKHCIPNTFIVGIDHVRSFVAI